MDTAAIRSFFMWCTILNAALLVFSFLIVAFAGNCVYKIHSKWFAVQREAFDVAVYCFIGLLKVLIIVFNLVPYLALVIMG